MNASFAPAGAQWLNEPEWRVDGEVLEMHAREGSDLWQLTSYGFARDTGHALLHPLEPGQACEVDVLADMSEQFDQAGLLVRVDETHWLKAGLELADGRLGASAVLHRRTLGLVDQPGGRVGRARGCACASAGDADSLTVRARAEGGEWRLVRLVPFTASGWVGVGPYCCSPSRAGYVARFRDLADGPADEELHP